MGRDGSGSLYQRYGVQVDPSAAMQSSQQNTTQGFKDALNSIDDLFQMQKRKYTERNTLALASHLKENLRAAGLGAEPIDEVAIKKQYGDLVDMDQINATVKKTTDQMTDEALDVASGVAGEAFGRTEDMGQAGAAFKKSLLAAGMKEQDATKLESQWRESNKFLPQDVEFRNKRTIEDATSAMIGALRENKDLSYENAEAEIVQGLSPRLRERALLEMRSTYKALSEMTPEQQEEYLMHEQRAKNFVDRTFQEQEIQLQTAKAQIDQLDPIGEGAKAAALKHSSDLGGLNEAIANHSERGFIMQQWDDVVGMFANKGLWDKEAGKYYQDRAADLMIQYGLSAEDALGLMVQSYQDLGKGADSTQVDAQMNAYATQLEKKKQALTNYNAMQTEFIKRRGELEDQKTQFLYNLKRGEQRGNVTGQAYDSVEAFKNSIFGGAAAESKGEDGSSAAGTGAAGNGKGTENPYDPLNYVTKKPNPDAPPLMRGGELSPPAPEEAAVAETPATESQDPTNPMQSPATPDAVQKAIQKRRDAMDQLEGPSTPDESKTRREALNRARGGAAAKSLSATSVQVNGEVRKGGSKAWRNNNPGNVKFTKYMEELGAVGEDKDGFAIFPDAETGAAAQKRLLTKGDAYKDVPLSRAIEIYAPKKDGNDTENYKKSVLAVVGKVDKKFRDYTPKEQEAILEVMRKIEGWDEGEIS